MEAQRGVCGRSGSVWTHELNDEGEAAGVGGTGAGAAALWARNSSVSRV